MRYVFTAHVATLLLSVSVPASAQDNSEETLEAFLAGIGDGNAYTVLELMSEESRAEAKAAADSLGSSLAGMDIHSLGQFLSGFGLEAAPDEIELWSTEDFLEILLISSGFDSTFAQAEESGGTWRIDVKNGVFTRMLRDLELDSYTTP